MGFCFHAVRNTRFNRCFVACNGCSRCGEVAEGSYCVFDGVKAHKMGLSPRPPQSAHPDSAWLKNAIRPAMSGATVLGSPTMAFEPSAATPWPVKESMSPAGSGSPQPLRFPGFTDVGTFAAFCHEGSGNVSLAPPSSSTIIREAVSDFFVCDRTTAADEMCPPLGAAAQLSSSQFAYSTLFRRGPFSMR